MRVSVRLALLVRSGFTVLSAGGLRLQRLELLAGLRAPLGIP